MSDRFEFTSEFVGETFEEAAEVTGAEAPVNPENPGFASLLTAVHRHRAGELDKSVLFDYATKLGLHVADCQEKLAKMVVPAAIQPYFEVALNAMTGAMEEFSSVIDSLIAYLDTGDLEHLDRTQQKLELIHQEFPIFIGQMQQFSQLQTAEVSE